MNSQQNHLIIALLLVSLIVWLTWEQDKNPQYLHQSTKTTVGAANFTTDQTTLTNNQGRLITVKTDVLKLVINTSGGNIEQALLLATRKDLKSKEPFQLLETTPEFIYQAESGLTGPNGPDNPANGRGPLYDTNQDIFTIPGDQQDLIIPLSWTDTAGNIFTKTFTLKRGEYAINVEHSIYNAGTRVLAVSLFGQLKQSIRLPSYRNDSGHFTLHTFRGAAYSTIDKKYEKYKFDAIANNKNLNIHSKGGWVAMLQQYFATAWIPCNNGSIYNFYTINLPNDIVAIGYKSQPILIQPGETSHLESRLWVGPEIQDKMAAIAPHLDLTVNYGWLWFISQPLFKLLRFIHNFIGNWGFSIIITTFFVRGIMYPLTKAQYISIAKMRMLQPKIQAMRERIGDDKRRQSQEIVALYKTERVNPLGGCFPLLIQMPIFLALYYMLMSSVELRHAPFVLWIHDLSAQDPYYILPILMGITMYLIQKMSPTTITDLTQHRIMSFTPIILTLFFLWFPSGLVLYYIVSNLVTIIQQHLIYRGLEKHGLHNNNRSHVGQDQ